MFDISYLLDIKVFILDKSLLFCCYQLST